MPLFTTSPAKSTGGSGKALPPELQKAMGRMTEISSLPEVTARIVQVVEDPRATAREMHEVVQTDPALAAKILKVVNSAFYGLPSQIASLERAILMLGLGMVKDLALAASLSRLVKADRISEHFGARDLWIHSIAVGVCARLLAKVARSILPDQAFVAGLMHDMGLIAVLQLFPEKVKQVTELCHQEPQNFCAVEERIIGADHQTFGAALAAKWKFPPGLRNAIAYHHEPSSLQPEFQSAAATVYIADALCCQGRYGFWLTAQIQAPEEWMLKLINVSPEQLEAVVAGLPDAVAEAEQIFAH